MEPIVDLGSSLRSKKPRKPPAEKLFDRELEQALQISLIERTGSQDLSDIGADSIPPPLSPIPHHMNSVDHTVKEPPSLIISGTTRCSTQVDIINISKVTDASKSKDVDSTRRTKNCSLPYTTVMDDSIQILGEGVEDSGEIGKSRRQKARKIIIESDDEEKETSDFAPDDGDNSSDDDSVAEEEVESEVESEDSDFSPKSKAKKKQSSADKKTGSLKGKNSTKLKNSTSLQGNRTNKLSDKKIRKSLTPSKPSLKSTSQKPVTDDSLNQKSFASPSVSAKSHCAQTRPTSASPAPSHRVQTRPSSASPASSLHTQHSSPSCLSAQWKPPAQANGNKSSLSTTKSPSSGLRLGLSRNMKVKPLHSSVKVT